MGDVVEVVKAEEVEDDDDCKYGHLSQPRYKVAPGGNGIDLKNGIRFTL